jgi:putative spermidine/putrescine transport system substrate-binding protein
LLAGGLTTLAAPGIVSAQTTPPKPDRIVVNASGGAMNSIFRRSYFTAFERLHGIRVVDTSPVDFGKLRAMVESGNPEWTCTEIGAQDAVRAKELNLLEPLDNTVIDRSEYPERARDSHVLTSSAYTTALGYNKIAFPNDNHPKGWAEFWDVRRFPGPRSLRNHPTDNLEFALLADGVPMDQLYPLDLDRAFRKLDQIRPHITVWWTTGAQPAQLLVDREVVLASGWNGRFYELARRGGPVGTEFTQGSLKSGAFGIPRGTRQAYWGQRFLAVMTQPELQAVYTTEMGYPGLNRRTMDFVPAELHPLMCTAPGNLEKQFWLDVAWWTTNAAIAQERWNRWMLRR